MRDWARRVRWTLLAPLALVIASLLAVGATGQYPGLGAEWKYTLTGQVEVLTVSSEGWVYALDSNGLLYIIDGEGREVTVRRIAPIAVTASGDPALLVAGDTGEVLLAETGEQGQILMLLDREGKRVWATYIPGYIVALSMDERAETVAVAYRPIQPGAAQVKITIAIIRGGEKTASWSIQVPATQLPQLTLSNPGGGRVAVYNPSSDAVEVYALEGRLELLVPVERPVRSVWLAGDVLYCCTPEPNGCMLHAYNLQGVEKWSARVEGPVLGVDTSSGLVAYYASNYTVKLVDANGNVVLETVVAGPQRLALSAGGQYLLVAEDYTVTLFKRDGEELLEDTTLDRITSASIAPSGKALAVADTMGRIYYYINPDTRKLDLLTKLLIVAALFTTLILALLRHLRESGEETTTAEEDEEMFPQE